MLEKYLYALGRGVRGAQKAFKEKQAEEKPDPAVAAKDITPPVADSPDPGSTANGAPGEQLTPLPRDRLEIGKRPLVMGIVNVTPDSFSDGGLHFDFDKSLAHALRLAGDGADILDIGGESTRPGAGPVDEDEEARRVLPLVRALAARLSTPISIDSMKAGIAAAAIGAGASIVNDVWGFQRDQDMARLVADTKVHCVLMHNRAADDPDADMFEEVRTYLAQSVEIALAAGIDEERIILDPGIGFGKTNEQSLALVQRLAELKRSLGRPMLLGVSRKRFVGEATGRAVAAQRDCGSLAAGIFGVQHGADILRVHNVQMHVEAVRMLAALNQERSTGEKDPH